MLKNYLIKSVKFIGNGVGLICFATGCEYKKVIVKQIEI